MTETRHRCEIIKEYADELRLKQREFEYALRYGGEEDVETLHAQVDALRDKLRAFNLELESYVPADCPPGIRRRMLQEREFIKYYYVMGFTMDKTAECMDLSRDTVYRIRTRITGR